MTAPFFDPFALGDDPFSHFARMRASGGIARGAAPYPELADAHYVFSHELVSRVLKHPALLQAPWPVLEAHVRDVLERGRAARAHVLNLGHGVTPDTDPDVLTRIVRLAHSVTESATDSVSGGADA